MASTVRLEMARDQARLREMGARIKELRDSRGLKQQTIADFVGCSLRQYQNWQAGVNQPEEENLEKLAEIFEVTPKYILRGETPDMLHVIAGAGQTEPANDVAQIAEQIEALTRAVEALRDEIRLQANEQEERALGVSEQIQQVQQRVEDLLQPRRARPA